MTSPRMAKMTNRGRTYLWGDETFLSVTTILSRGVPKPALVGWAAKSVAEFAIDNLAAVTALRDTADDGRQAAVDLMKGAPNRNRDKAAALGTAIHEAAEAYSLGHALRAGDPQVDKYVGQFAAWCDDFAPDFHASEVTVFNRAHQYAGTLDAVVDIAGERWLVDYKTGKDVYAEVGLQLAAYRYAEFIGCDNGTELEMPEVDRAGVLHLGANGYRFLPVRTESPVFGAFLAAQQVQRFIDELADSVVGGPIAGPALHTLGIDAEKLAEVQPGRYRIELCREARTQEQPVVVVRPDDVRRGSGS